MPSSTHSPSHHRARARPRLCTTVGATRKARPAAGTSSSGRVRRAAGGSARSCVVSHSAADSPSTPDATDLWIALSARAWGKISNRRRQGQQSARPPPTRRREKQCARGKRNISISRIVSPCQLTHFLHLGVRDRRWPCASASSRSALQHLAGVGPVSRRSRTGTWQGRRISCINESSFGDQTGIACPIGQSCVHGLREPLNAAWLQRVRKRTVRA